MTRSGHKSFVVSTGWPATSTPENDPRHLSRYEAQEGATAARDAVQKAAEGKDPQKQKTEHRRAKTVKELGEYYMRRHAKRHKKPASIAEDQRILDKYVYPPWQNIKARNIRRRDVVDLLDTIADKNGPIQSNRVRSLLSKMFNIGFEAEIVENNPVAGTKRVIKEQPKKDYLNAEQIKALWAELDNREQPTASVFKMILVTGQRPGEVCKMRWQDIDRKERVWKLPEWITKNGREHACPLSPIAIDILDNLERITGAHEWVFALDEGKHVKYLQSMTKRINATERERAKKAKTEPLFRFGPHMLRRTCATHMGDLGVSRYIIGALLNHKSQDASVTAIYDRSERLSEKRRAAERWSAKLNQILTGEGGKVVAFG